MLDIPNFKKEQEFQTNFNNQVLLCTDELDYLYLVKCLRVKDDGHQWLALPISNERLHDLKKRKLTLKDAVLSSETGTLFGYWTSFFHDEHFAVIEFDCEKLPEDFLPSNNEYLQQT